MSAGLGFGRRRRFYKKRKHHKINFSNLSANDIVRIYLFIKLVCCAYNVFFTLKLKLIQTLNEGESSLPLEHTSNSGNIDQFLHVVGLDVRYVDSFFCLSLNEVSSIGTV